MSDFNIRKDDDKTELAIAIRENSGLEDLVKFYPEEEVGKLLDNKERLDKITHFFQNTTKNVVTAVLAMKCNPRTCPHRNSCVLAKNNIAPEGYQCPIEKKVISEVSASVMEELDIDPQSTIEMEQLYDLIDAKLLDMRTSGMIAETTLVQEITSRSGNNVTSYREIAPEFKIKMDLKRLKASILDEFMATRRSKKRYGLNASEKGYESIVREAMRIKAEKDK